MVEDKIKKVNCYRCRDKGLTDGCPECGKVLKLLRVTILDNTSGEMDNDSVICKIPKYYRGLVWDKNTFLECHASDKSTSKANHFAEQLNKVHDMFVKGEIPNKSVIIIAPRQSSKQIWANSCIQFAHKHGYKVMPILSSDILKRVLANMFDKPHSAYLKELGYNLDDILTADCLFVNIDSGWQRIQAYSLIDDIMCKRANFDRPTIFISRFSIDEMCKGDYDGTFSAAISRDNTVNRLRYPAVIQYM